MSQHSKYRFILPSCSINDIINHVSGPFCLNKELLKNLIQTSWESVDTFITKFMLLNSIVNLIQSNDLLLILKNILSSLYLEKHHFKTVEADITEDQ